jgi:oligopeptidase B
MRTGVAVLAALVMTGTMLDAAEKSQNAKLTPPVAAKKPKETKIHGETLVDNYFWLREKTNPQVIQYLEQENAYTDAVMAPTAALQKQLYDEMLGHIKQTDVNVPYRLGEYFYYSRTEEGKQYPIFARKRGSLDAAEEVLLDQNEMAKGLKFFAVGATRVSEDGNLLAYTTDTTGYRQYTLHVKDLRSGELLPDTVERVDTVDWATDNKTLFFVTEDPVTKRADKFFRHVLGSASSDLLYEEKDELFDLYSYRTRDRAFIIVQAESKLTTEVRYLPAGDPSASLRLFNPREKDHKYFVDHRGDLFYVRSNSGGAKNYRLLTVPDSDPQAKNWSELIAHRPEVKIDDFDLFANHMVLHELQGGSQTMRVYDFRTKEWTPVAFAEPVYTVSGEANPEFNSHVFRYNYQSLVTPPSIYDYDMDAKKGTLLKQTEVPNYDPSLYQSERVYATATDGTKIPMSLVYRKELKRDGKRPALLYAYGSYGIPNWPAFRSTRLPLLDRGVIYAIAHIRGGGELGEPWREAGRMMVKKNTFTDFINAAEFLVKEKYTSSDRLAVQGGSAGGLLMGAVTNMRPDLFRAVDAQVPFVDVINTMLDASLPLTTSEYEEWGNPNLEPDYRYMKSYSPYDNVKAQKYPAMLVETSLNDSQVPYWEGAKLVAKIRSVNQGSAPVLLKTNMGAGHGGSSGRYDALHEAAFRYAFMLSQIAPAMPPRNTMTKE